MNKKTKAKEIIGILEKLYPTAGIQLNYSEPFELLVAVVLSAQCTDARVNQITEKLFIKYRSIEDYANANIEEFEKDIFSAGYYKAKARNIINAANKLINVYNKQMPSTIEELLTIPGVGRKSANVILGHCFGIPGIVVDTHVIRLSNLIGFVKNQKNAEIIERELNIILPKDKWIIFTHLFILHGRAICIARRPKCEDCQINTYCDFYLNK